MVSKETKRVWEDSAEFLKDSQLVLNESNKLILKQKMDSLFGPESEQDPVITKIVDDCYVNPTHTCRDPQDEEYDEYFCPGCDNDEDDAIYMTQDALRARGYFVPIRCLDGEEMVEYQDAMDYVKPLRILDTNPTNPSMISWGTDFTRGQMDLEAMAYMYVVCGPDYRLTWDYDFDSSIGAWVTNLSEKSRLAFEDFVTEIEKEVSNS